MRLKTIEGCSFRGKNVLVRVDFNVPMKSGKVTDDTRIKAHLDTLGILRRGGARVALASHLGRPKGKVATDLSLFPVSQALGGLLGCEVPFCGDCVGERVSAKVGAMSDGGVCLLENLRFYPGEEADDPAFAEELADPFDLFVMDAFSAAHRAHASTVGVTRFLPSCAGKLMEREVAVLSRIMEEPKKPMVIILGGAKVSDKIGFIKSMLEKGDVMLVGGAMAFPFLKASGKSIGGSFCEEGTEAIAAEILETAKKTCTKIVLPVDFLTPGGKGDGGGTEVVRSDSIPEGSKGLDIGPETVALFFDEIQKAGTILWNGPLGLFERKPFGEGTRLVGLSVADKTAEGAVSVLGGGDTAAAANMLGFAQGISHISTGGGATLEFFEKKGLPGITPLLMP
ncbi:MAG: phosphoglycerate kinase [Thermovirgaceae bacterium]|nr:phosphoglycerate kinase [Synergistales bacterium]HPC75112.1 phosphoglycerate kinase [Synergistales bacterium]HRS48416.1 phosphoglycerate kinase [Thermovirgaceae bacterium]HRU90354.1 phosphoglycerate kinase [Thermovirgaceae bacterium]